MSIIFDCLASHKKRFQTVQSIKYTRPANFCILIISVFVFCCSANDYDKAENIKVPETDRSSRNSLDSKNKNTSKWVPPTGIPYGDPVPWVSSRKYYVDKAEYKKARENIDRRLLELGRRPPRNSDEVKVMMKRCRDHVEDLNYTWSPFGTWTGGVLVCGLLLPPPYVFSCVAVEGEPYTYYNLEVNGVILYSPLGEHDDCGWPYEIITSATMRYKHNCLDKVYAIQEKIEDITKDKSIITTTKKFLEKTAEWANQFRNIVCDDPDESVDLDKFTLSHNNHSASYKVNIIGNNDHHDLSLIVIAHNPVKHKKREPKTPAEIEAIHLETCRLVIRDSKECLERSRLLVAGELYPKCLHQFEIEEINRKLKGFSLDLDLEEKYRYIEGLGVESPECLIRNGLELDD